MPLKLKNWIYIHVPKNGGTWVRRCLSKLHMGMSVGHNHGSLWEVPEEDRVGRQVFTTARDPWSWYQSWYLHVMFYPQYHSDMAIYGGGTTTFKDVIRGVTLLRNTPGSPVIVAPSFPVTPGYPGGLYSWMFESLCHIPLTEVKVLDMYHLQEELGTLLGIGLTDRPPILNTREHRDPKKTVPDVEYDAEMIEWVRQADAKVIDQFGYHIPFQGRS